MNEQEVWDQIRRGEEESVEMGAMEHALLLDHCVRMEGAVKTTAELSKIGPRSCSMAAPFFTWRSGDDVTDGGQMPVASIGQNMGSTSSVM